MRAREGIDSGPVTRTVHGTGCVERVGELARELGSRALLVTDPGLVAVGHAGRVERLLAEAGLEVATFAGVRENPTTLDVDRCVEAARGARAEVLVGLGGGSSIDTAKGCNLLLAGGGRMRDYLGIGKAKGTLLPLIAVPTTAGTGTEVQSFALISDEATHDKMACGDPQVAARVALLDAELTLSLPRFVTACTGLDALTHAVETAVTLPRNGISSRYSQAAFVGAQGYLPRVLADPLDLDSRSEMLRAASFAGLAIEHSMLGAAHSMANPLTAAYDVHHGHAVGMMLPRVVRFNAADPQIARIYAGLAVAAGLCAEGSSPEQGVEALVRRLVELIEVCGVPATLAGCGVPETAVEGLAAGAASQWTARFNPREVREAEFIELYRSAFAPLG